MILPVSQVVFVQICHFFRIRSVQWVIVALAGQSGLPASPASCGMPIFVAGHRFILRPVALRRPNGLVGNKLTSLILLIPQLKFRIPHLK